MKRFFAMILVVAMLFNMIPTAFAEEGGQPVLPPSQEQQEGNSGGNNGGIVPSDPEPQDPALTSGEDDLPGGDWGSFALPGDTRAATISVNVSTEKSYIPGGYTAAQLFTVADLPSGVTVNSRFYDNTNLKYVDIAKDAGSYKLILWLTGDNAASYTLEQTQYDITIAKVSGTVGWSTRTPAVKPGGTLDAKDFISEVWVNCNGVKDTLVYGQDYLLYAGMADYTQFSTVDPTKSYSVTLKLITDSPTLKNYSSLDLTNYYIQRLKITEDTTPEYSLAVTGKTGLVYNGEAQQLVQASLTADGAAVADAVFEYSANSKATDAGTHNVTVTVTAKVNGETVATATKDISVTIAQATPTVSVQLKNSQVYYNADKTYTPAAVFAGATITVTGVNGTVLSLEEGDYALQLKANTLGDSLDQAGPSTGAYLAYLNLTAAWGTKNPNYEWQNVGDVASFQIIELPYVLSVSAIAEKEYTGNPITLVSGNAVLTKDGASVDGATILFSMDGGATFTADAPTATNAGDYTFIAKAMVNGEEVARKTCSTQIKKANSFLKLDFGTDTFQWTPDLAPITLEDLQPHVWVANGDGEEIVTYPLDNLSPTLPVDLVNGKVGTYNPYVMPNVPESVGNSNYYLLSNGAFASQKVTVLAGDPVLVIDNVIPPNVPEYTGAAQNLAPCNVFISYYDGAGNEKILDQASVQLSYSTDGGTTFSSTAPTATEPGTYTIILKVEYEGLTAQQAYPATLPKKDLLDVVDNLQIQAPYKGSAYSVEELTALLRAKLDTLNLPDMDIHVTLPENCTDAIGNRPLTYSLTLTEESFKYYNILGQQQGDLHGGLLITPQEVPFADIWANYNAAREKYFDCAYVYASHFEEVTDAYQDIFEIRATITYYGESFSSIFHPKNYTIDFNVTSLNPNYICNDAASITYNIKTASYVIETEGAGVSVEYNGTAQSLVNTDALKLKRQEDGVYIPASDVQFLYTYTGMEENHVPKDTATATLIGVYSVTVYACINDSQLQTAYFTSEITPRTVQLSDFWANYSAAPADGSSWVDGTYDADFFTKVSEGYEDYSIQVTISKVGYVDTQFDGPGEYTVTLRGTYTGSNSSCITIQPSSLVFHYTVTRGAYLIEASAADQPTYTGSPINLLAGTPVLLNAQDEAVENVTFRYQVTYDALSYLPPVTSEFSPTFPTGTDSGTYSVTIQAEVDGKVYTKFVRTQIQKVKTSLWLELENSKLSYEYGKQITAEQLGATVTIVDQNDQSKVYATVPADAYTLSIPEDMANGKAGNYTISARLLSPELYPNFSLTWNIYASAYATVLPTLEIYASHTGWTYDGVEHSLCPSRIQYMLDGLYNYYDPFGTAADNLTLSYRVKYNDGEFGEATTSPVGLNAGTYTVEVSGSFTYDGEVLTDVTTYKITVKPKNISDELRSALADLTVPYKGIAYTADDLEVLINAALEDAGIDGYCIVADFSSPSVTLINAGDSDQIGGYIALNDNLTTDNVTPSDDHLFDSQLTITKAVPTVEIVTKNLLYDANKHSYTEFVDVLVNGEVIDAKYYDISIEYQPLISNIWFPVTNIHELEEATAYKATATLNSNWATDFTNYESGQASAKFQILPNALFTSDPASATNLLYNGAAQQLLTEKVRFSYSGYSITVSCRYTVTKDGVQVGEPVFNKIPTATEVGTYTVTCELVRNTSSGIESFSPAITKSVDVTIARIPLELTASESSFALDVDYKGSAYTPANLKALLQPADLSAWQESDADSMMPLTQDAFNQLSFALYDEDGNAITDATDSSQYLLRITVPEGGIVLDEHRCLSPGSSFDLPVCINCIEGVLSAETVLAYAEGEQNIVHTGDYITKLTVSNGSVTEELVYGEDYTVDDIFGASLGRTAEATILLTATGRSRNWHVQNDTVELEIALEKLARLEVTSWTFLSDYVGQAFNATDLVKNIRLVSGDTVLQTSLDRTDDYIGQFAEGDALNAGTYHFTIHATENLLNSYQAYRIDASDVMEFTILPVEANLIAGPIYTPSLTYSKDQSYNGTDFGVTVSMQLSSKKITLSEGTDYRLIFTNVNDSTEVCYGSVQQAGSYRATVELLDSCPHLGNITNASKPTASLGSTLKVTQQIASFSSLLTQRWLIYDGEAHTGKDFFFIADELFLTSDDGEFPFEESDLTFTLMNYERDQILDEVTDVGKYVVRVAYVGGTENFRRNYRVDNLNYLVDIDPQPVTVVATAKDATFDNDRMVASDLFAEVKLVDAVDKVWVTITGADLDATFSITDYHTGGAILNAKSYEVLLNTNSGALLNYRLQNPNDAWSVKVLPAAITPEVTAPDSLLLSDVGTITDKVRLTTHLNGFPSLLFNDVDYTLAWKNGEPTETGEAVLVISCKENGNYTFTTIEKTVQIYEVIDLGFYVSDSGSLPYTDYTTEEGRTQILAEVFDRCSLVEKHTYSKLENDLFDISIEYTEADTRIKLDVTFTLKEDWFSDDSKCMIPAGTSNRYTWSMYPVRFSIQESHLFYNGDEQEIGFFSELEIAPNYADKVSFGYTTSWFNAYSKLEQSGSRYIFPTKKAVGDYDLIVRAMIGNTELFNEWVRPVIAPAPLTVLWPTESSTTVTYDGSVKAASDFLNSDGLLVGVCEGEDVHFEYSFDREPINAGTYALTVSVSGNDIANYQLPDVASKTYEVQVSPQQVPVQFQAVSLLYDGAEHSASELVKNVTLQGMELTHYTVQFANVSTALDAGEYKVIVGVTGNSPALLPEGFDYTNYAAVSAEGTAYIIKAPAQLNVTLKNPAIPYDADFTREDIISKFEPEVTILYGSEKFVVPLEDVEFIAHGENTVTPYIGNNMLTVIYNGNWTNTNYELHYKAFFAEFEMTKIPATAVPVLNDNITYNGKRHYDGEFIHSVKLVNPDNANEVFEEFFPDPSMQQFETYFEGPAPVDVAHNTTITITLASYLYNIYDVDTTALTGVPAVITPYPVTISPATGRSKAYLEAEPAFNWIYGPYPAEVAPLFEELKANHLDGAGIIRESGEAAGEYAYLSAKFGSAEVNAGKTGTVGNFAITFAPADKFVITKTDAELYFTLKGDPVIYRKDKQVTAGDFISEVTLKIGNNEPIKLDAADYSATFGDDNAASIRDVGTYDLTVTLTGGEHFANVVVDACTEEVQIEKQNILSVDPALQVLFYDGEAHAIADFFDPSGKPAIIGELDGRVELLRSDLSVSFTDESIEKVTELGEYEVSFDVINADILRNYNYTGANALAAIAPREVATTVTTMNHVFSGEKFKVSDFIEKVELIDADGKVWVTVPADAYEVTCDTEILNAGEYLFAVTITGDYSGFSFEETAYVSASVTPLPVTVTSTGGVIGYGEEIPAISHSITWDNTGSTFDLQAIRDILAFQLVYEGDGSMAVGEFDILYVHDAIAYLPGETFMQGNFEVTYESTGKLTITNTVDELTFSISPVSNIDNSIALEAGGMPENAPVTFVMKIEDSVRTLDEMVGDGILSTYLDGKLYDLNGTTYEAGWPAGTEIEISAMVPTADGAHTVAVNANGEPVVRKVTVSDALTLTITASGKKYDFGEGTAIVAPNSELTIATNSAWVEAVILTIGSGDSMTVQVSRDQDFVLIAGDTFATAKEFKPGDALTKVQAQILRPSNAAASLLVGVDTYDGTDTGSKTDSSKATASNKVYPALITSPVADGVGFVAGFAPAGTKVYVSVGQNTHYSSDSAAFHSVILKGDDAGSTEDDILYFHLNLKKALRKGNAVFVKWVAPDGSVYRNTLIAGDFKAAAEDHVWAEAYGESILGGWWNESKTVYTPGHHFILHVKASEIEESVEIPILAYGGYRIGSLTIEKTEDGLTADYTIEADIAGYDGKLKLISFSEKPEFEALHEAILCGESLNPDEPIANEEFWLYAAFEVYDLHLPMQQEDEYFHVIGQAQ